MIKKRFNFFMVMGCLVFISFGCASTALLPATLNIVPPSSDIPTEVAAFSGVWEGRFWNGLDTKLVVEKIDNNEAKLIFSYGLYQGVEPSYFYQTANVTPEPSLVFIAPNGDKFEFKMDNNQKEIKLNLIEKKTGANLWALYKRSIK